jgi:hypothetical protein
MSTHDNTNSAYCCPRCHSGNVQKFSVIHSNGVHYSEGRITNSFGVAPSYHNGTQTSDLAQRCAPPFQYSPTKAFTQAVFAFFVFLFFWKLHWGFLTELSFWLTVGLSGLGFYGRWYNENKFQWLYKIWDSKYLCMKCDHAFRKT